LLQRIATALQQDLAFKYCTLKPEGLLLVTFCHIDAFKPHIENFFHADLPEAETLGAVYSFGDKRKSANTCQLDYYNPLLRTLPDLTDQHHCSC
jgi:hypothetical protein